MFKRAYFQHEKQAVLFRAAIPRLRQRFYSWYGPLTNGAGFVVYWYDGAA